MCSSENNHAFKIATALWLWFALFIEESPESPSEFEFSSIIDGMPLFSTASSVWMTSNPMSAPTFDDKQD
jgi:hypothetical protein